MLEKSRSKGEVGMAYRKERFETVHESQMRQSSIEKTHSNHLGKLSLTRKLRAQGGRCISMVELLLSACEVLVSVQNTCRVAFP